MVITTASVVGLLLILFVVAVVIVRVKVFPKGAVKADRRASSVRDGHISLVDPDQGQTDEDVAERVSSQFDLYFDRRLCTPALLFREPPPKEAHPLNGYGVGSLASFETNPKALVPLTQTELEWLQSEFGVTGMAMWEGLVVEACSDREEACASRNRLFVKLFERLTTHQAAFNTFSRYVGILLRVHYGTAFPQLQVTDILDSWKVDNGLLYAKLIRQVGEEHQEISIRFPLIYLGPQGSRAILNAAANITSAIAMKMDVTQAIPRIQLFFQGPTNWRG